MEQNQKKVRRKGRAVRIVLKTILFIFLFVLLIFGLILLPPVQNFIKGKAVTYLQKKLHTKLQVGKIFIGLPKTVIVKDFYIEDRQKDTLAYGKSLKVNIGLWKLIFNGETVIDKIELANSTVKIKRNYPDSTFNYQFIVDAFSPAPSIEKKDTTASAPITLNNIILDKIRLVFKDQFTGNDAEVYLDHFDTKIDKVDPDHMIYDIPDINVEGLTAMIYQYKPLVEPEPLAKDLADAKTPVPMQLLLDRIGVKQIFINYRNDVSALYSTIKVGEGAVHVNELSLDKYLINISNLSLENTTANVRLGKKEMAKVVVKEAKQEIKSQAAAGWRIMIGSLKLDNDQIVFENDNEPRLPKGMDYAHIKADSLFLHVDDFLFSKDSVGGTIAKASVKEQSGLSIDELETKFLYTGNGGYLKDLKLRTPGTDLKRTISISYPSIEAVKANPGIIEINAAIEDSRIAVRDILLFMPSFQKQPAFANPNATWYIDGIVDGSVNNLDIKKFQFNGLSGTSINMNGVIAGLPKFENARADFTITRFSTNKSDMLMFAPPGAIPSNITLPSSLSLSGKIKGDMSGMRTNLSVQTDLGNAKVDGLIKGFSKPGTMSYDATVQTTALKMGAIMQQQEMFGPVTANFRITGIGTDPKTASASMEGKFESVTIKGYEYRDLSLKVRLSGQQANVEANMMEPNLHFSLNATADLSKEFPAVTIHAIIDSMKAQSLHLATTDLIYRGNIDANIPVTDPKRLEGTILFTQTLVVNDGKRMELDSAQILAGRSDTGNFVRLQSSVANAALEGRYELPELGTIFMDAIQPYFAVMPLSAKKPVQPYDFTLNARVVNSPLLAVFAPTLKKIEPIEFSSHFSTGAGWNASLLVPFVDLGTTTTRNFVVTANTVENRIELKANLDRLVAGGNMNFVNTTVTATIANNKVDFVLNNKDGSARDRYNLEGSFELIKEGEYAFSLKPEGLLLNYQAWTSNADNRLLFRGSDINATNLVLQKDAQSLKLSSLSQQMNAPLEVTLTSFKLGTLTGFVSADSLAVDGTMNGKLLFTNLTTNPVFTGDMTIENLAIQKDTVGNVQVMMDNKGANSYHADLKLTGRGNDLQIEGSYYPQPVNNNQFDLVATINSLPMATLQAFSAGAITEASGSMNGKFVINGTASDPSVNGDLNFAKAGFNLKMLNSYFTVDQEKIKVSNEGFVFNDFEVKDSAGNSLSVNGVAATSNFQNYQLDLTVRANDFRALNSTKRDNKDFYGQLYFNTNLKITGTESIPRVDGRLTVNEKTKMTIVLPQAEPGVVEREGIVEFIDRSAGVNDSLFGSGLDTLNKIGFTGMDISVNLQVDKAADITLVIDEGNGDFINLQGEASITADVDRTGKIVMSGTYELEKGSYEISFNLLRRKFAIQKGSRITWQGEPTLADVDITAVYTVNTAPLDLVKNQLSESITATQRNTYLQKLPFEVTLKMTGELMRPRISFDIKLPENKSFQVSNDIITNVKTRLEQLRQEEGEMNKQVFSLLLLSRFVSENPFASSGGGMNASTLARQSVSKLLTEQLNQLASDLISGVDLNFDVQSSEDYTTGSRQDRTDLNVGLSKRLMNDRLTVTVGSNFELEGAQGGNTQGNNIAGNVAVDYKVSKDGRYLLRAYRKNDYQGVIDGYVIETGVGFIITVDYNRFRELFRKKLSRQERRQRRQERKVEESAPKTNNIPAKQ